MLKKLKQVYKRNGKLGYEIKPETLQQFLYYDSKGNEIYGDIQEQLQNYSDEEDDIKSLCEKYVDTKGNKQYVPTLYECVEKVINLLEKRK